MRARTESVKKVVDDSIQTSSVGSTLGIKATARVKGGHPTPGEGDGVSVDGSAVGVRELGIAVKKTMPTTHVPVESIRPE